MGSSPQSFCGATTNSQKAIIQKIGYDYSIDIVELDKGGTKWASVVTK